MKTGNYFYLTAAILIKVLQKYSSTNLIGCHGNQKAKFEKIIFSKFISSEAIRGIKLKHCRNVNSIASTKMCFFIPIAHALWQLNVSID